MSRKRPASDFRGQMMLQIAYGKYFRPDARLNETRHRAAFYTNLRYVTHDTVHLPVGSITGSIATGPISTIFIEATDKLEAQRSDGTDDFMIATGGTDLLNDIAYLSTFVLNRTFSPDHDLVRRLTSSPASTHRRHSATSFFPDLFNPDAAPPGDDDWRRLHAFMETLIGLSREQFAFVMRAIRRSVDATRRAVDDPTGAYVDLVASLESLSDAADTVAVTWERYDAVKRRILDSALEPLTSDARERVRIAVLEADKVGAKRRFISSTLARVADSYYRDEAQGTRSAPRSADLERLLSVAYDIRSRRSHVLEDLGEEAWLFTDGAETTSVPMHESVLTLAGLWRLVRHVVTRHVERADQEPAAPWDYRGSLPGIVQMRLAPQYWISGVDVSLDAGEALLGGIAEAYLDVAAGRSDVGMDLRGAVREIESLVPRVHDSNARTALVAVHVLWHSWVPPEEVDEDARSFASAYEDLLTRPSMPAFAAALLSRRHSGWTAEQWHRLAVSRRHERETMRTSHYPARVDAALQLCAADCLEEEGRHDEAVVHAAYAVGEVPGDERLARWEQQLLSGRHDASFEVWSFICGSEPDEAHAHTEDRDGAAARSSGGDSSTS